MNPIRVLWWCALPFPNPMPPLFFPFFFHPSFARPTLAQSETLGDRVEQMHFGTGHSKYYFVLNMVGFNCLNGMSTLFPKVRDMFVFVGGEGS